jgi:predicted Zn-ribbon and HTH transcriptional regulator
MKCKCQLCGYEWQARTENPKSCPNCKSYKWNKEEEKGEQEKK